MRVTYDIDTDTLSVVLKDGAVVESDEAKPGVILDYDSDGDLVSLEILDASHRGTDANKIVFETTGARINGDAPATAPDLSTPRR